MFLLLFIVFANAYDVSLLNEFTGDVDIYDMGTMGRGKNAASWHYSLVEKTEVFYYLAMQPWRHLEWRDCKGTTCYKFIINEDASLLPDPNGKTELGINTDNDYCRKEYAHPMATFDIDWEQIDPEGRLDSLDINGITCFKHPAKEPLAWIYLQQHYTDAKNVDTMTPCRFDFIGGKSITFRSFNTFSPVFISNDKINGYLVNKTRCTVPVTPNNVDTDLAIVLGISDTTVDQKINEALKVLENVQRVGQKKVYYMSGESVKTDVIESWDDLKKKHVSAGAVDAVINVAKKDLAQRVKSKAIYRGTMVVLMDRALSSSFDAETEFDRNNITVHTILYNPNKDNKMRIRARSLLSVGHHYHEFADSGAYSKVANELYIGIRANLTERCNRTSCNGFCDGRDRCTCPMCCENTCFFSYCNTTTATCMPWPEAKPKEKIQCNENICVGEQKCIDLQGCVYTKYNESCAPSAKCMKPYCDSKGQCKEKDICGKDLKPSYKNRCWSYECDTVTGNCKRLNSGKECPPNNDLCKEYVCDENLVCSAQKKECVKTSPYTDMNCYTAMCNKNTGKCENRLYCDGEGAFTGCGATADKSVCECDPDNNFECKCSKNTAGFCNENEICNSLDENNPPKCDSTTTCGQDLFRAGCRVKKCNNEDGVIYWEEYNCDKNVTIKFANANAEKYCKDKFGPYCEDGVCLAGLKEGQTTKGGCGECSISEPVIDGKLPNFRKPEYHRTYTVSYTQDCSYLLPKCPNGKTLPREFFQTKNNDASYAYCADVTGPSGETTGECKLYDKKDSVSDFTICHECFSGLSCYKSEEYKSYVYDEETGTCSYSQRKPPQCSVCNEETQADYKSTCTGKVSKTYTYTLDKNSKTFDYTIPKECTNDQCIPVREYNCLATSGDSGIPEIVAALKECSEEGSLTAEYHYSTKWDHSVYVSGGKQSDDFMNEVEAEAYCIWTVVEKNCHYCGFDETGENMVKVDKCEEVSKEFGNLPFTCVPEDNRCEVDTITCATIDCIVYTQDGTNGCVKMLYEPCEGCEKVPYSTCLPVQKEIDDAKATYKQIGNQLEVECHAEPVCEDGKKCGLEKNSKDCEKAYTDYLSGKRDFGCWIPNVECDFNTYHCTYRPLTTPEEDARFFTNRDGVHFNDKCYTYECKESFVDGKLEHHWIQTEASKALLDVKPENLCQILKCDPATGEIVESVKQCSPVVDFKMTESQAQCFECKCSYLNGDPVLIMRPSLEEETYELDACGNCIVREKKTGDILNNPPECVLDAPVNLTGAIAGATVAASVVFGLIGSMVVVSIGAFQTYQLVSSAMKNVISTTLENPEFVAADNEATNVLNNE